MALILLHWLIAGVAFWEAWQAFQRLRVELLRGIIFGALGLIHGLVPAIGLPWYERTPDPYLTHVDAALFTLVGTILLALGWHIGSSLFRARAGWRVFEHIALPENQKTLRMFFFVCAALGMLAWIGSIYASGATLIQAFTARRLEFRGEGNGILGGICVQMMAAAFVPGFLGFYLKGRYRLIGILYAIGFAGLLYLGSRGTRAPATGMVGSIVGGLIMSQKISAEKLIMYATAITVTATLAIGLYPLRHRMSGMSMGDMAAFLVDPTSYENALRQDPLNYHDHFVGVTACFPKVEPFVDAASYRRIVFFFVPSSKYPNLKPRDPNRIVAEALFGENDVDWMHPPSMYGDVYINFWGWKGIGVLFLHGMMLAWFNAKILKDPMWFLIIGPQVFYLGLIGLRGQPYTIFVGLMSSLFLMLVLSRLLRIRIKVDTARVLSFPATTVAPRRLAA